MIMSYYKHLINVIVLYSILLTSLIIVYIYNVLNSRTKLYSGLIFHDSFPANTRRWRIAGLMLAHHLRRWCMVVVIVGGECGW